MFVQSAAFVKHHGGNVVQDITVFGQESNPNTWKLAKMNLGIRGIEADLGSYNDTFSADQHKNEKFDYILANPPFNLKNWGGENLREDVRWEYGTPPTGNANFAWMQHMIWHLNASGKIGLVLANGSLSSQTSGEGDIRRAIVEDDLVERALWPCPASCSTARQFPCACGSSTKENPAPQDALHRCPRNGHHGNAQAARVHRRGHR